MKIWTLTEDTDFGTTTTVFPNDIEAHSALLSKLVQEDEETCNEMVTAQEGTSKWMLQILSVRDKFTDEGSMDTYTIQEHEAETDPVYNANIQTLEDVKQWVTSLFHQHRVNFHPDNPFEDYIDEADQPTYTSVQAAALTRILVRCWEVCVDAGTDMYEVSLPILTAFINR